MKRIYSYILIMVCVLLFASCQKDLEGVFIAEIENFQGNDGKVYLNDNSYACWEVGDKVRVSINDVLQEGGSDLIFNDNTVSFSVSGEIPADADIKAFEYNYYYGSQSEISLGGIAMEQWYEENAVGKQKLSIPMVAHGSMRTGNVLEFYNLASMIEVRLTNTTANPIQIDRIELSDVSGEYKQIHGGLNFTQGINEPPVITGVVSDMNESEQQRSTNMLKVRNSDNGKTIVAGGESSFYIAIAPNVSAKYNVKVYAVNNPTPIIDKTAKQSLSFPRNTIAVMPLILETAATLENGSPDHPFLIGSLEDMMAKIGGETTGLYFKQTADIDLSMNTEFRGIGTNEAPFEGIYDGCENNIINNTNHGLFLAVGNGAVVKNLNVSVHNAELTDTKFGGVITEVKNFATIESCNVSGTITTSGATQYVGGICGYAEGNGTINIFNCSNSAIIEGQESQFVGGILGFSSVDNNQGALSVINGCVNNATILKGKTVGGIVGNSIIILVVNCKNSAMIESKSNEESGNSYVGGICGLLLNNCTIRNCVNRGYIAAEYNDISGGVVGAMMGNSVIENCYSNANVHGNGGFTGGIVGFDRSSSLNNVYVQGDIKQTSSYNGSWITAFVYSPILLTNMYRPINEDNTFDIGSMRDDRVVKYDPNNMVGNDPNSLLSQLNANRAGHESEWLEWVNVNGKPGFVFEL